MKAKALQWHTRPDGQSRSRCPICGCNNRNIRGEHRATTPDEGFARKYLVRDADGNAVEAGGRWREAKPRMSSGPTADTLEMIAKAATLATSHTLAEVGRQLGKTQKYIENLQHDHGKLWQQAYDNAMSQSVHFARAMFDAKTMLDDPDRYIATADRADRWLTDRGESLFPPAESETLPEFFERYYRPVCMSPDANDNTVYHYRLILRRWYLIQGNLPLREITAQHLATFRDVLMNSRGIKATKRMSRATVASYLERVQWFLDKAGPARPRNRDAAGILETVPWVKPPRIERKRPNIVTDETLNALYEGAVYAELPRLEGVKPPAWWRALFVLVFNTGLRRGNVFSLRTDDINWQRNLLTIPAKRMKTRSELCLPLNDITMSHLRRIKRERELLVPWPHDQR